MSTRPASGRDLLGIGEIKLMLSANKPKKPTAKKPDDKRKTKTQQNDIPPLTKAQMDAIRNMEPQQPISPMLSSLLDF